MTSSRKIRMNRPMRKAKPGDVETIARQNKDKFIAGGASQEYQDNFDDINWNSKSGTEATPKGYKVRKVTHAQAGLPVLGDP